MDKPTPIPPPYRYSAAGNGLPSTSPLGRAYHDLLRQPVDQIRIDKVVALDPDPPTSISFCFLAKDVIATTGRKRDCIFDAVKQTGGKFALWEQAAKDKEVRIHGEMTPGKLKAALKTVSASPGESRTKTFSGWCWKGVKNPNIGTFHALGFWSTMQQLRDNKLILFQLIEIFELSKAPVYYEGVDSREPMLYRGFFDSVGDVGDTHGPRSLVARHLTPKRIIDVLVTAQMNFDSLTPLEREVAWEFRSWPVAKKHQHRFPPTAPPQPTSRRIRERRGLLG